MSGLKVFGISCCLMLLLVGIVFGAFGRVDDFGATEGKEVDSGVVFVDGKYIEPPYVVSRRGLALYINDVQIRRPKRHIGTPVLPGVEALHALSSEDRRRLFRALEATRDLYEENLRKGCGYIFSSAGGHVILSPYAVAYDLPKVVQILMSGRLSREQKLEKLRRRNWHLHIDVESLVDNFTISNRLNGRMQGQAERLLRIEEFGIGEPHLVESGFLFYAGEYVEAPYLIQRRGLGMFVNGRLLGYPVEWPIKTYDGEADPSMPPVINSESSWYDEVLQEYLGQKLAYLHRQYTRDQAAQMMAEVIMSLPLVTEARRDGYTLHIVTSEGIRIPVLLVPLKMGNEKLDRNEVVHAIEKRCASLYTMLAKGYCCFLLGNGSRTIWPAKDTKVRLTYLVHVLESKRSEEEKRRQINALGLPIILEGLDELMENYSPHSQLRGRLVD